MYMSPRCCGLQRTWSASFDSISKEKSLVIAAFWKTSWTMVPFSICFEPPSKLCIPTQRKHRTKWSSQHILWCKNIQRRHRSVYKNWFDVIVIVRTSTLNMSPSTARLMQRIELEMLVPEIRLSGSKTRKPCSLSMTQRPPSGWPSRWTTSPHLTGVVSLETTQRKDSWRSKPSHITFRPKHILKQLQLPSIFEQTRLSWM